MITGKYDRQLDHSNRSKNVRDLTLTEHLNDNELDIKRTDLVDNPPEFAIAIEVK